MPSLRKIVEVIENMSNINEIGQEFIRESRNFWAAKKDIFDSKSKCSETTKLYPGMASFMTLDDFQEHYSKRFANYISAKGMNREISNMARCLIKDVSKRFEQIEPYDNTILPIIEKYIGKKIIATIVLPTDDKLNLFYFGE